MKKKFTRRAVYVAYDGKEFDTMAQCKKYEKEHPEPSLSVLAKLVKELKSVEWGIFCHKVHGNNDSDWSYFDGREQTTWFCGRMHQAAIKALSDTRQNKELSGLDKLIAIGEVAYRVKQWRDFEKKAYVNLMELRKKRDGLRAAIDDAKKNQPEEDGNEAD